MLPRPESSEITVRISLPTETRIDVLVALRALEHGGDVDAALVRERAPADEGEVVVVRDVRHLGHVARELGDLAQALGCDAAAPILSWRSGTMVVRLAFATRSP